MTNADRKKWTTPKLRVYVKSRAEERVLIGCKMSISAGLAASPCPKRIPAPCKHLVFS
jgi:hypothetical protein